MQDRERLLAEELERRLSGGIEVVFQETEELAELAEKLTTLPRPVPGKHAQDACAALLQKNSSKAARWYSEKHILAWAAAILIMLTAAGGGAVSASRDSLPGETLYPVKRLFEGAQLFLTVSPEGKAEKYLCISETRLNEFMMTMNSGTVKPAVLHSMLESNRRAMSWAERVPESQKEAFLAEISSLCSLQGATLSQCCLSPEDTAFVRAAIAECLSCCNCVCMPVN